MTTNRLTQEIKDKKIIDIQFTDKEIFTITFDDDTSLEIKDGTINSVMKGVHCELIVFYNENENTYVLD